MMQTSKAGKELLLGVEFLPYINRNYVQKGQIVLFQLTLQNALMFFDFESEMCGISR